MAKVLPQGTKVVLDTDFDFSEDHNVSRLLQLQKNQTVLEVRYLSIGMRYILRYGGMNVVSVPMESVIPMSEDGDFSEMQVVLIREKGEIVRVLVTTDRRFAAAIALRDKRGVEIFVCAQALPTVWVYDENNGEERNENA